MTFGDLKTGDIMALAGQKAVVLAIDKDHPDQAGSWLVVWYILDEGRLSFDCLFPDFELIPGSRVHRDGLITWRRITRTLTKVNR